MIMSLLLVVKVTPAK